MHFPYLLKDKYWNLFRKKEFFLSVKNLKTWDWIFLFFFFSPWLLNIFLILVIGGENHLAKTFTMYTYFATSADTTIAISAIYHIICLICSFCIYLARTYKAIAVYNKMLFFKKTSPSFYEQMKFLVKLSIFFPFFSQKTYSRVFGFTNYKLPHDYSI